MEVHIINDDPPLTVVKKCRAYGVNATRKKAILMYSCKFVNVALKRNFMHVKLWRLETCAKKTFFRIDGVQNLLSFVIFRV